MHPRIDEILTFWFGESRTDPEAFAERQPRWFRANPDFDDEIRRRFMADLERAKTGELDAWAAVPAGRLAVVVLLDQFPRNIFRGTPDAFMRDQAALRYCLDGIDSGADRALSVVERSVFYLPLNHAEDLGVQERAVQVVEQLVSDCPPLIRPQIEWARAAFHDHRDTIRRFGRFPHRNAILGRTSTVEELDFLHSDGPFGPRS